MQQGKINVLFDASFGSSGKGLVASKIVDVNRPEILLSTNRSNSGHTVVVGDVKFVSKIIPTPAILNKIHEDYNPICFLGGSSAFEIDQLIKEIKECGLTKEQIIIHPTAMIVDNSHKQHESKSTIHIASTMSGSGRVGTMKAMRDKDLVMAKDVPELQEYVTVLAEHGKKSGQPNAIQWLRQQLSAGKTLFGEISQGFALSMDHGLYPYTTSRNCTPAQYISDLGLDPRDLGDVIANFRTYPIRVGNVTDEETGEMLGYSGDFYPDEEECTWADIVKLSGMPDDQIKALEERERTTVTKRIRRVAKPLNGIASRFLLTDLLASTRPDGISVNFLNYIDFETENITSEDQITDKVRDYMIKFDQMLKDISEELGIEKPEISALGFGADIESCFLQWIATPTPGEPG